MMSILLVELAKRGLCSKSEMSEDHQSRANLVALTCSERDERELFTVVVSRWHMCAGDSMWVSAVGDSGRRAVILRARMIGIIDASCRTVHEREPRFFSRDQQNVEERRAHLHASSEWTNIPLEGVRLFAHGAGAGVTCTPKVSLCDATICVVVADFLWPLWLGGRCAGIRHLS